MTAQDKAIIKSDVKKLLDECLNGATRTEKEKIWLITVAFLMGSKTNGEKEPA